MFFSEQKIWEIIARTKKIRYWWEEHFIVYSLLHQIFLFSKKSLEIDVGLVFCAHFIGLNFCKVVELSGHVHCQRKTYQKREKEVADRNRDRQRDRNGLRCHLKPSWLFAEADWQFSTVQNIRDQLQSKHR